MITNLSKLEDLEILVVGDIMMDEYVHGRVDRMSPEAPVPVVLIEEEHSVLGGAGNVAANLIALGAGVTVAGVVGDDTRGTFLINKLLKVGDGNASDCLVRDAGRVTTQKVRLVANGKQVARIDREMTYPLADYVADYMFKLIGKMNKFDAVIVSDYGKGVITPYVFHAIMKQAELFNIFVAVDPSGTDYSKYKGANIITPNLSEAIAASGSESIIEAAEIIMEAAELPQLLITLGRGGMRLFEHRDVYHIDTAARGVFDVSGAGDTVIAAFTLAVSAGYSMAMAATISNIAAGIVVGKPGTATVSLEELEVKLEKEAVN